MAAETVRLQAVKSGRVREFEKTHAARILALDQHTGQNNWKEYNTTKAAKNDTGTPAGTRETKRKSKKRPATGSR